MELKLSQKVAALAVAGAVSMGCVGMASTAEASNNWDGTGMPSADGWGKPSNGGYKQYINGELATGWWQDQNKDWHYSNEQGYIQTGWVFSNGYWYYLNNKSVMETGWLPITNSAGKTYVYYFAQDGYNYKNVPLGSMQTGWIKDTINGKVDKTSALNKTTNWAYTTSKGEVQFGWHQIGGKWYYFQPKGATNQGWMTYGWVQDTDGKYYYCSGSANDGAMKTGWIYNVGDGNAKNHWQYLKPSGELAMNGWQQVNGTWYWLSPVSGDWGAMAWNQFIYDGKGTYYLDKSGAMLSNSWITVKSESAIESLHNYIPGNPPVEKGDQVYAGASGALVNGDQTINGKHYMFNDYIFGGTQTGTDAAPEKAPEMGGYEA